MPETPQTILVELDELEARALLNTANLMAEALEPLASRDEIAYALLGDRPVRPLASGAMKLELALLVHGAPA